MSPSPTQQPDASAAAATLIDVVENCWRISVWKNVTISVFALQATLDVAERALRVSKRIHKAHPLGHSSFTFILNGTPAPTPDAQAVFAQINDPSVSHLACMALVIEGGGFWASAIRSSVTSIRLAASVGVMVRAGTCVDDLFPWFGEEHAKRTGTVLDPSELKSVLLAARALGCDRSAPV